MAVGGADLLSSVVGQVYHEANHLKLQGVPSRPVPKFVVLILYFFFFKEHTLPPIEETLGPMKPGPTPSRVPEPLPSLSSEPLSMEL